MDKRNVLYGHGVVPGIVIGRAHILDGADVLTSSRKRIAPEQVKDELQRFRGAVEGAWRQLEDIKEQLMGGSKDPGHILEAHQMMLKDEELQKSIRQFIQNDLINSEWAVQKTLAQWEERFLSVENEYLRERFSDLKFVCARLLRVLSGENPSVITPPPDAIIVAQELSPADAILLGRNAVAGLVLASGGKTSHTVIIAKAFEIPTMVGVKDAIANIGEGDLLILNGHKGEIVVNPDARMVTEYRAHSYRIIARDQALLEKSRHPAVTLDHVRIHVMANLDFIDEIDKARDHGAEGVGLYRSEFVFLVHDQDITQEDVHFFNARELVANWTLSGPLTLRTFDMGGDKFPLRSPEQREPNPALGERSLRLALAHPAIFKAQVRGFLRALSENSRVLMRIMFPLVTSVTEFLKARALVSECERELIEEGYDIPKHYQVGAMLEVPAALMAADALAKHCQFFSIGSNDLIQYSLAVDRGNEKVAYLYQGLHPGILKMMEYAIRAATAAGVEIALCGDLATEPIPALLLLGLGLRVFSIPPVFIPYAKEFLRQLNVSEIEHIAREALTLPCADDIEAFVRMKMGSRLQDSLWAEMMEF